MEQDQIEQIVQQRVRSLRTTRGWSLEELASRVAMDASTLSRIETGKRRLTVDHLTRIAGALGVTVDELLVVEDPDDVLIHPVRDTANEITYWHLTRSGSSDGRVVAKLRYPVCRERDPELGVHPGREWFYVLKGTVRLILAGREMLVGQGSAAEFDTMTPHRIGGYRGSVEILGIFDRHGERLHLGR